MGTLSYLCGRTVSQIIEGPPKETIVPLGEFVGDSEHYIFYLNYNNELLILNTIDKRIVFTRP